MGLEFLALGFLLVLFGSSLVSVSLWLWRCEQEKLRFQDALALEPGLVVEGAVSGDLARPLALDLEVDGQKTTCAAVVRGDRALWHVELMGLDLPVQGSFVVVDRSFRSWSKAARGLSSVSSPELGTRILCLVSDPEADRPAPALLSDIGRLLEGPFRPLAVVVERSRIFLEAPRGRELSVLELKALVHRARSVAALVAGAPLPPAPPLLLTSTVPCPAPSVEAPSGIPVVIPLPASLLLGEG